MFFILKFIIIKYIFIYKKVAFYRYLVFFFILKTFFYKEHNGQYYCEKCQETFDQCINRLLL
jgi:hypothetical protein